MANAKIERKKLLTTIVTAIIVFVLSLFGINVSDYISNDNEQPQQTQITTVENLSGYLELAMVDVGQADGFVLIQNEDVAVIDCGTRSTGKNVVEYLKSKGITKLNYVIGTHPHDDHMGGMYDVITNFEVEKIIIPEVTKNSITTNWYLKLMNEIKNGGYEVIYPSVGAVYSLGDASMKVIAPYEEPKENLNNYSIVLKVSFGEMDILMTGDMEKDVEKQILKTNENIEAEILKMGHHGSDTSNSVEFLDAVKPEYALISSKVGNKYKHPIKSVMEQLEKRNITVFRTDESGTVVAKITNKNVEFECDSDDFLSGPELELKLNSTK